MPAHWPHLRLRVYCFQKLVFPLWKWILLKQSGAEFLYTFALVFVILNVATSEVTEGNDYYGAAIAFVVFAGALTVGEISGGSFNPAVTGALFVSGVVEAADLWIHLLPQFVAGILAVQAFNASQ